MSALCWPTLGRLVAVVCLGSAFIAGCRGGVSEDPPINLAPDMDAQQHRRPQSESPVFADHRAARTPDPHTIARNHLKTNSAFYRGQDANGKPIARAPIPVTQETLDRGEERYNIYCTPCHDKTGSGFGMVPRRLDGTSDAAAFGNMPNITTLKRLREAPDGEIFDVITHGKAPRMPSYASQIPEADRWAIVTWVRVLQAMNSAEGEAK